MVLAAPICVHGIASHSVATPQNGCRKTLACSLWPCLDRREMAHRTLPVQHRQRHVAAREVVPAIAGHLGRVAGLAGLAGSIGQAAGFVDVLQPASVNTVPSRQRALDFNTGVPRRLNPHRSAPGPPALRRRRGSPRRFVTCSPAANRCRSRWTHWPSWSEAPHPSAPRRSAYWSELEIVSDYVFPYRRPDVYPPGRPALLAQGGQGL